jgi:hypothetical protein
MKFELEIPGEDDLSYCPVLKPGERLVHIQDRSPLGAEQLGHRRDLLFVLAIVNDGLQPPKQFPGRQITKVFRDEKYGFRERMRNLCLYGSNEPFRTHKEEAADVVLLAQNHCSLRRFLAQPGELRF